MAEESSDVPKELIESVRDVIGRKIKISVKKKVKLETKGDKVDNKVLVLASCRAFLLTSRIPTKLELTFSYLEIQGVTSSKPGQLIMETEKCSISMKMASSEDVNEVLAHIGTCLRKIFPGLSPVRILKKVTMEPSERLANLQALWDSQTVAELGPCGGFSQMYACVCDWLGFPYREEVQWDVDTIYLTQDTRELNLQDFSHLDHRDLIPIVAALEYNQWFTKLSSKDLKLSTDVCEQILRVVSRSNRLEELVLENAGLRTDFAQKLASALAHNPNSGLHTINLASNPLEDRALSCTVCCQFAVLTNTGVAGVLMELSAIDSTRYKIKLNSTPLLGYGMMCTELKSNHSPPLSTLLSPKRHKVTFFQSGVDPSALPMRDSRLLHLMHSRDTVFWDQTFLCSCWARRQTKVLYSEPFLHLFGLRKFSSLFAVMIQNRKTAHVDCNRSDSECCQHRAV